MLLFTVLIGVGTGLLMLPVATNGGHPTRFLDAFFTATSAACVYRPRRPRHRVGRSLGELDLKARLGLTPIALRRGAQVFVNPAREERVADGDELILIGRDEKLDQLRG